MVRRSRRIRTHSVAAGQLLEDREPLVELVDPVGPVGEVDDDLGVRSGIRAAASCGGEQNPARGAAPSRRALPWWPASGTARTRTA